MIGPHIIGSVSDHFETLRRWQPRLILVLNPSQDQIRELRQLCPKSFIVGRVYRPDGEVSDRIRNNPKEAARWAHHAIMERFTPEINAWQVENEVLQQWDGLPFLNEFALERMRLANEHGYKAAILAFSVGNPDLPGNDPMAHWHLVSPAISFAEQHNHVVAVHQYGSPTLWQPDSNWYIHRLEHQVLPKLPHSRVKFVCTEYGIDNMINGFHSGRSGWKNTVSASDYTRSLIDIGSYLERYRDRVVGYSVFTLGTNDPSWESYNIAGEVANSLASHYQSNPQPAIEAGIPVVIPGGGNGQPVVLDGPSFQLGEVAHVATQSRVRSKAGLNGDILGVFEKDVCVSIVAGPEQSDGLNWWKVLGVRSGGKRVLGWSAQQDNAGTQLLKKRDALLPGELRAPFEGQFKLTQFFGENPEEYVKFGLRGHNGLDFGLPIGTQLQAVDAGWAFQVQIDPNGFGQFVKLRHSWGESLYAHMSSIALLPGQQVVSGQVIGLSGNTGNSMGPHLHFALRISPYDMNDGWGGYRDPLPWVPVHSYSLPLVADVAPVVQPQQAAPQVARRLSSAFEVMKLKIEPLSPSGLNGVKYVVKDVFTTQDGSWEVGQKQPPYGIVDWARASYLKPWGAPDVFDDAGAATHLFGAVIGLDGKLVPNHAIRWRTSDNQNHAEMRTKEKSGWANLFINKDSAFWPQDGQIGPWQWAPEGAVEGISGGGLPNQWHVSTFVVWQAVPHQ